MLSLNEARRVIRAAERKAQQLGCAVNIAVVDEGGHVMAQVRMDGAWLSGIDAAACKAYTARAFDAATRDMMTHARMGGELSGIDRGADRRIVMSAGGVPLRINGRVCGAIGVSGCASSEDETIALAGASALMNGHDDTGAHTSSYSAAEIRNFSPSHIGRLGNFGNAGTNANGISGSDGRSIYPSQIARLGSRSVMNSEQYCGSMQ